jgi:hypothetical protein
MGYQASVEEFVSGLSPFVSVFTLLTWKLSTHLDRATARETWWRQRRRSIPDTKRPDDKLGYKLVSRLFLPSKQARWSSGLRRIAWAFQADSPAQRFLVKFPCLEKGEGILPLSILFFFVYGNRRQETRTALQTRQSLTSITLCPGCLTFE